MGVRGRLGVGHVTLIVSALTATEMYLLTAIVQFNVYLFNEIITDHKDKGLLWKSIYIFIAKRPSSY